MIDDPIRERLRRLPVDRLAEELISLGESDSAVRERVGRLSVEDDPEALAAALKRSIESLGRDTDFITYSQSFAFGRELQHIVDTIHARLLPRDPNLAFEVADLFLESDARVFECVDDSAGAAGDVFRGVCNVWLEAAAKSTTKRDLVTLFKDRVAKDGNGSRSALLPDAAILSSEAVLRGMAEGYLVEAKKPRPENDRLNYDAPCAASNARQLAIALRDPRLFEEATRAVGGGLNNLQRIEVVRKYLEFGDPRTALALLAEITDNASFERLDLLAECYGKLGKVQEEIATLETIFESTLWKRAYERILALRPQAELEATREWGRRIALGFTSIDTAAIFLFEAGWPDDGERLCLSRADELATKFYSHLLELAGLARTAGRQVVEVICYRHLIRDVLGEARSRAYGHAVSYLEQLDILDSLGIEYGNLEDHAAFVEELRKQHGRKSAFWGRVEGKRR